MSVFKKEIVVTDEEWKERLEEYWQRELDSWARDEDFKGDPALEHFFKTGNVEQYIREALAQGQNPGCAWSYVLLCNPSRSLSSLKENIQIFWTWILENPQERLPNALDLKSKVPAQEYFEEAIGRLGSVNTSVLDPVCAAELFLWIYGESFEAERLFPMPLGSANWQPVIKADPERMFFKILGSLKRYLFDPDSKIEERQSIMLVDYWLTTIPLLTDMRIFDTVLHEEELTEDGDDFYKKQWTVRSFLANMQGYNVWYEEMEELPHNNPKLERYIMDMLEGISMPEEYDQLIKFIHKYKEDCLEASE